MRVSPKVALALSLVVMVIQGFYIAKLSNDAMDCRYPVTPAMLENAVRDASRDGTQRTPH